MKKLYIILTILFVSYQAFAVESFTVGHIRYDVISCHEVKVAPMQEYEFRGRLVIPPYVRHGSFEYRVVKIDQAAFPFKYGMTCVVIPHTVTEIGYNAFYECKNLLYAEIGKNVEKIGGSAFEYCESLLTITIPDKVTVIPNGMCHGCKSLSSVTALGNIELIKNGAFLDCESLIEFVYSGSPRKEMHPDPFKGCNNNLCFIWQ